MVLESVLRLVRASSSTLTAAKRHAPQVSNVGRTVDAATGHGRREGFD